MEEIIAILAENGFTHAEARVYLSLLQLGTVAAGPILHKAKLQNSVLHSTLRRLIEKGVVSFVMKGRRKEYTATDPKNILRVIEEKRRKFNECLPRFAALRKESSLTDAKIYKGLRGFKNALQDFVSDGKPGDEYLIFSLGVKDLAKYEHIINYYRSFEDERKKKGIISKAIAPVWQRQFLAESAKKINMLFVSFPTPLDVSVFRKKVLFSSWEDEGTFFILYSAGLAESFRTYFYSIWNKYKK